MAGAGAHLPFDPRSGKGRIRPFGQHPSQYLCQRSGSAFAHPAIEKGARIFLAGQITGVEGYVESSAMGILAGINAGRLGRDKMPVVPPESTAMGALAAHISREPKKDFQPMNINFGLFPPLEGKVPRRFRGRPMPKGPWKP